MRFSSQMGVAAALSLFFAGSAAAQPTMQPRTPMPPQRAVAAPADPQVAAQGFFDLGFLSFTAKDTFEAVLGESTGLTFGGGGQFTFGRGPVSGLFVGVEINRYQKDGERVFVFNNEVFRLGIRNTVTVMPILVNVGYKFRAHPRFVPYALGGFGSYQLKETSDFAVSDDDVDERWIGYHFGGGAEIPLWRWFGVAVEGRFAAVPDSLGGNGVAVEFDENDLGGASAHVKVIIGQWSRLGRRAPARPAPPVRK